jgi:hypothetical protein
LPAQLGVQTLHCPLALQMLPAAHAPQVPPQPSGPHVLPAQLAAQHCPDALHVAGAAHDPQLPPQPSEPQVFPAQLGTQTFTHVPP